MLIHNMAVAAWSLRWDLAVIVLGMVVAHFLFRKG